MLSSFIIAKSKTATRTALQTWIKKYLLEWAVFLILHDYCSYLNRILNSDYNLLKNKNEFLVSLSLRIYIYKSCRVVVFEFSEEANLIISCFTTLLHCKK